MLLRHDEPGGGWHFDWMLERPGEPWRGLLTFRTRERPDGGGATLHATRLGDHRRAYLEYEGEVSGGRGRVTRVAAGVVEALEERPDGVRVVVRFGGARAGWMGAPGRTRAERWVFRRF
ncbi:MAG TPA: hypothetical protein VD971_12355 [Phycisphaerales bacterium]|nr:hypothetical protein [Phycisphaerales bacterium]